MTTTEITPELSTRIDTLIDDETERFRERQPRSREMSERAHTLAGGATSSWQVAEPHAVWISHGAGSKLYDVDGNEYSDFHGGYGVSLAGHGHPAIVEAVRARVGRGTHFAQPTVAAPRSAPTTPSSSPTTSPSGSGSPCGGSATPAPSRQWMRCT